MFVFGLRRYIVFDDGGDACGGRGAGADDLSVLCEYVVAHGFLEFDLR